VANSAWAMLDADTSRYFRYIDPSLLCGAGLQRCRGGPPASNALLGGRPTLQPRYGPVPSQLLRRGTTEHYWPSIAGGIRTRLLASRC